MGKLPWALPSSPIAASNDLGSPRKRVRGLDLVGSTQHSLPAKVQPPACRAEDYVEIFLWEAKVLDQLKPGLPAKKLLTFKEFDDVSLTALHSLGPNSPAKRRLAPFL